MPFENWAVSDPYTIVAGLLFRLGLGKESYIASLIQRFLIYVTFLLELEDITLVYHSIDQELNRNELHVVRVHCT